VKVALSQTLQSEDQVAGQIEALQVAYLGVQMFAQAADFVDEVLAEI
jgi:hypothetical protein